MKITLRSMVTSKFLKMKKINTTNINTFSGEMYLLCKQYNTMKQHKRNYENSFVQNIQKY